MVLLTPRCARLEPGLWPAKNVALLGARGLRLRKSGSGLPAEDRCHAVRPLISVGEVDRVEGPLSSLKKLGLRGTHSLLQCAPVDID